MFFKYFSRQTLFSRTFQESPVYSSTFQAWPQGYKTFFHTQLSTKFILLINVKMPTIVGILTFISMIDTIPESLKARKVIIFQQFSFYEQLKFHAQFS